MQRAQIHLILQWASLYDNAKNYVKKIKELLGKYFNRMMQRAQIYLILQWASLYDNAKNYVKKIEELLAVSTLIESC